MLGAVIDEIDVVTIDQDLIDAICEIRELEGLALACEREGLDTVNEWACVRRAWARYADVVAALSLTPAEAEQAWEACLW